MPDIGSVRVLSHVFDVEFVAQGAKHLAGTCDITDSALHVLDGLPEEAKKNTVIHELLHLMSDILDLGLKEVQINGLACGLKGLIEDNPQLMAWLQGLDNQ